MKAPSHALCGIATAFRRLSRIAFFATIVLIPVRLRIDLLARPNVPIYGDYTDFLLFAADAAMLATLAFWGLSLLAVRRPVRLGPVYIWLPLTGLTLAGLLSALTSVDRALTLYHVVRLAALFAFFLYIVNEMAAPAVLIAAVALQGTIQAVVAIAQFLAQTSIGLQVLGEYELSPAWNGVSIVSSGSDRILRAYGLSDHPNILGGCLAFGLIVLMAAYLGANRKTRLMLLVAFLPMSVALLLTFSRAAWLAFGIGAAFLIGIQVAFHGGASLRPLLWLILAAGLTLAPFTWKEADLLGVRLGANGAFGTVPQEEQSLGERVLLVQAANRIFATDALTGIGLGAAPVAMKNAYPKLGLDYQPPHLSILEAALETGILGATFYFLLLILPWAVLLRHRELLGQPLVAGAAALLLAITVVGLFDYYTWLLVPGRLWQWVSWGMLAVSVQRLNGYELA